MLKLVGACVGGGGPGWTTPGPETIWYSSKSEGSNLDRSSFAKLAFIFARVVVLEEASALLEVLGVDVDVDEKMEE